MKQKILIVGSSNVDFVVGVREMPLPGETLMGSSFDNVPGGKGANQACACGRLGGDSVFLSCVGRNAQGDMAALMRIQILLLSLPRGFRQNLSFILSRIISG